MKKIIYKTEHWNILQDSLYFYGNYVISCVYCEGESGNFSKIVIHYTECDSKHEVPPQLIKIFNMLRYLDKVL